MNGPPKKAAIDLDEVGDKRLSEISAAEFLQALEQVEALGSPVEDVSVKDALAGARAAFRLPFGGGWPEKKKVEREKFPLEKSIEKLFEGFPEKKKVELEKLQIEKSPEKLFEGFPEKKKVELEEPVFERPFESPSALDQISERLTRIEAQLSQRA